MTVVYGSNDSRVECNYNCLKPADSRLKFSDLKPGLETGSLPFALCPLPLACGPAKRDFAALNLRLFQDSFVLPDGPDFFHSIKKSAKNLVKNNLGVFSMGCISPIDGFLTSPQGGYVRRVRRVLVCCCGCHCYHCLLHLRLFARGSWLLTSGSWLFALCPLPFACGLRPREAGFHCAQLTALSRQFCLARRAWLFSFDKKVSKKSCQK